MAIAIRALCNTGSISCQTVCCVGTNNHNNSAINCHKHTHTHITYHIHTYINACESKEKEIKYAKIKLLTIHEEEKSYINKWLFMLVKQKSYILFAPPTTNIH